MSTGVPRGLYAVTSARVCADEATLRAAVGAALDGGAAIIQYLSLIHI